MQPARLAQCSQLEPFCRTGTQAIGWMSSAPPLLNTPRVAYRNPSQVVTSYKYKSSLTLSGLGCYVFIKITFGFVPSSALFVSACSGHAGPLWLANQLPRPFVSCPGVSCYLVTSLVFSSWSSVSLLRSLCVSVCSCHVFVAVIGFIFVFFTLVSCGFHDFVWLSAVYPANVFLGVFLFVFC